DHATAVEVDGRGHGAVIAVRETPRRFRVEPLVQRDGAHQVGEDDRHDLARDRLHFGTAGVQRRPAREAEASGRAGLAVARRAARRERAPTARAEAGAFRIRRAAARAVQPMAVPRDRPSYAELRGGVVPTQRVRRLQWSPPTARRNPMSANSESTAAYHGL